MKVVAAAALLAVIAIVAPFMGQERSREKFDKDLRVVKPSEIKWEKADGMPEGVWVSHLTGDSSAAPYVDMLKFSRGTRIPLHWHSANHVVSVISGTLLIGREGAPQDGMGMEVPAGGYVRIAAKSPHWTFAKEDTIFVVSGDKENDLHKMDKEEKK